MPAKKTNRHGHKKRHFLIIVIKLALQNTACRNTPLPFHRQNCQKDAKGRTKVTFFPGLSKKKANFK
jgi:hypothetical protein